jgi:hypothetical protein
MPQNVLYSGIKSFLNAAAADEVIAEICPALCDRLDRSRVCALNHRLHLVHVALKPKFRGGLFREALVGRNILQGADALIAHGYCPLISMYQNTCHFPRNAE